MRFNLKVSDFCVNKQVRDLKISSRKSETWPNRQFSFKLETTETVRWLPG